MMAATKAVEWSEELERYISKADEEADKIKVGAWVPVTCDPNKSSLSLWETISLGEENGLIRPGMRVLELGSGSGCSTMTWAYRGYPVTGIEINPGLVQSSRKVVQEASHLFGLGADIQIFEGNYYPKSYVELKEKGCSKALCLEADILDDADLAAFYKYIFHPVPEEDVYQKHGLDLATFDIFYAYIWDIQSPSVAEMFSLYAWDDAVLCLMGGIERRTLKVLDLERRHNHYITKSNSSLARDSNDVVS